MAARWGAPSGEPQGEVLVCSWVKLDDAVPDVFGGPLTSLRIVVQEDELHPVADTSAVAAAMVWATWPQVRLSGQN